MLSSLMLKAKLKKYIFSCHNELLKCYLQTIESTLVLPFQEVPLLAIDLEMTGLDSTQDQILSIGVLPIVNGQLILAEAEHKLLKIDGSVGDSAVIHGIMDNHLDDAISPEEAMLWFLEKSKGKVLVAHHAPLDAKFIQQLMIQLFEESIPLAVIDTLVLERKRLLRQHEMIQEGALRLGACRARYHLPVYNAHNALVDALACGELLLAQSQAIGKPGSLSLNDMMAWV